MALQHPDDLRPAVERIIRETMVTDVHTHIYPPCFGDLLLWGVDDLITYHYLIAELFRWTEISYDAYWGLTKQQQADLIWKTLFEERSPIAESCRGVLTVLQKLGLDVAARDIAGYRSYFSQLTPGAYVDIVFELAGVQDVVMTNDPFDEAERKVWLESYRPDRRFKAALRLDSLLNGWDENWQRLVAWGHPVEAKLSAKCVAEVQRFLKYWCERMEAVYLAVSLPPTFAIAEESNRARLIRECVLPVCAELNLPFAMMIGVKKLVNPDLRLAGDSVGKARVEVIESLCAEHPRNKFLVTMLSRENQHELCVTARKFRNLLVFGCWWFLNNPSLVEEISRMRFELLGLGFIPQHSDARVLDQLIYKWEHNRRVVSAVLCEKYADLLSSGWRLEEDDVRRDVRQLLGGSFWDFIERKL